MRFLRGVGRVFAVLGILLAFVLLVIIAAIFLLERGPSESAKVLFVQSAREASWFAEGGPMSFVPELFLSKEEVKEITERGKMKEMEAGESSDISQIDISTDVTKDIEIIDITGGSYKGKLMIISDPSRIFLGTLDYFSYDQGEKIDEMIDRYTGKGYSLIGGVNGGDFIDGGVGASFTAMPLGAVMSEGEISILDEMDSYHICGFTEENILVVGEFSQDELRNGFTDSQGNLHVFRDFVYTKHETGPFLVVDGNSMVNTVPDTATYGGGKNPRTAIGQRKDGAILLLTIDGRQANSLGASFVELANIMLEYGAYNACAMDGGTSTQMFYEGELISNPYSAYGVRKCPTGWLVKE